MLEVPRQKYERSQYRRSLVIRHPGPMFGGVMLTKRKSPFFFTSPKTAYAPVHHVPHPNGLPGHAHAKGITSGMKSLQGLALQ